MRRSIAVMFVMCVASSSAFAQQAALYGVVTDTSKAVVPGVTVTVANQGTGLKQVAVTNDQGEFQVRSLPLGTYSVTAELQGFTTVTRNDIAVGLESQVRVDVIMELGTVREAVTVVGQALILDTQKNEVAGNVTAEQIRTLPVAGRQWINLATLMPGTGQDAIRSKYYNSVNIGAGITFYSNGFYVDNVTNNWQQQGEPRQDFPQDAIAEFRVHSFNAPPVYGFAQGGYLSTVTKSGTNEFHGDLFEYYRHKDLNAKTVFQAENPDYHRHQVGGAIGGPIVQNKAQFFVADEYTNEANFYTVNTRGIFPTVDGTYKAPVWNHMIVGRVDGTLNDKHRLFGRYAYQRNLLLATVSGGTVAPSGGSNFSAPRDALVLGETWIISTRTVNELRFQRAMATYIGWPASALKWKDAGSFPAARVNSLVPVIIRPDLTTGNNSYFIGPERRFEFKDDLTHLVGNHELAAGFDLNWILWTPDNMGIAPVFTFSTDAPFDPNNRVTYPTSFSQRLSPTYDRLPSTEHSFYVGDTWRVTPNLTLTPGIRYDLQTGVWNEDLLNMEMPEVKLIDRVIRPGGKQDPALFPFYDNSERGDKNNFGPRIGATWNVDGSGRQVVRGGYGMYYNRYRANGQPRAELDPLLLQVNITNPNYPDPYLGRDPFAVAAALRNIQVQGNRNRTPYAHQFSVGTTRQIGQDLGVSADVTIANGENQVTTVDANYFASPAALSANMRPNPNYGQVTEGVTIGVLRYRAIELRADKRLAHRWQLLGSYTLASAKNTAEGLPPQQFDTAAEYGYAEPDRRHRLTVSGIVQAPLGIQASGILRYQSSLPSNITAGRDLNADGVATDRVPGVTRNTGCRGLDLSVVNAYRAVNARAAVDSFRCADYLAIDLVVSKRFPLGGQRDIEAIFQVFNVTNRANYLPANGNALAATFGQSSAVAAARQGEVAVRFRF